MATEAAASAPAAVRMGTRRSALAQVQTEITKKALREAFPEHTYETVAIATNLGDVDKTTALHEMGAKSLWTYELEVLLEKGELDLIVHSLKDVPTQLPSNMALGAILPRADPRDALCVSPKFSSTHKTLASLPAGSVVGTSSVRRSAQIARLHPHLKFANCRGNVGTRLAKLDAEDSEFAAIILAAAGLERLGLGSRITTYLSSKEGGMLHAVGQGAIGIEIMKADKKTLELLSKIACPKTSKAALAERSLLRTLEGGCSVPIGVETEWKKATGITAGVTPAKDYDQAGKAVEQDEQFTDDLTFRAVVISLDGKQAVEAELTRKIMSEAEAEEFGIEVAKVLVNRGAAKILEEITLNRKIIDEQGGA